ncbi:15082_t:CDS:2 [Entrophospora sp. SA101]|nr:5181_t:CDS:2 [Entrophospora sp. SA101]CAJ0756690.1 18660_t:CDS:2 [Entrophospora sp. SA101]CAJ0768882.1 15082_t:CDS:2 [Entrophospora sp. SA101]
MATVFKAAKAQSKGKKPIKNKQRVLALSTRGINFRQRHLLNDLETLFPHFKKDSKLDQKYNLSVLNELAELNNCNNCVFFEARKKQDLYMWTSKAPNGPSIKFHVQNIHTVDELKMTGNCLKGSRPILSFDKKFDSEPHWILIKEVFTHIFGVPKGTRRSKPFIDHVISFTIADNRIWFRNFQITEKDPTHPNKKPNEKDISLLEIGPRFVMNLIRIFEGSFNGATLMEKANKYQKRLLAKNERRYKIDNSDLPENPMDDD